MDLVKKNLLIIVILIAGLLVGLYLVQNPQIFKGRAATDATQAVTIHSNGEEVKPDNKGIYNINSLNIQFGVDVEKLK